MKVNRYLAEDVKELGDHLIQIDFFHLLLVGRITLAIIFFATKALARTETLALNVSPDLAEVPSPGTIG